ncbi:hypothetical protein Tco_0450937 [Tanacetum coccineum]
MILGKIPICYDDDEDNYHCITPVLPIEEPDNSLSMGDEHLDTIPNNGIGTGIHKSVLRNLTIVDYNDDSTSSDDDSYENIDYVDASPPDVEIVSLEVVEIVDPEVGRIDDDILLTIKDNILREKLLNVNLLIAKIDALRDNPTPSSEKEYGQLHYHVDFSQYDSFIFDLSNDPFPPADRSDFYHEEFADELAHIISPPEYDHFCI